MNLYITFIYINILANTITVIGKARLDDKNIVKYKELGEHTMVTNSEVFPYAVAILKKSSYVSAGALIDENWVLTAADSLFLIRESMRLIKVRLGSINYKRGGVLLPIKSFVVHPYFDDKNPQYDIALIMLPERVRISYSLSPIRVLKYSRSIKATHFIVTAWSTSVVSEDTNIESMETVKRRRMLTVSHLHPSAPDSCTKQLTKLDINQTDAIMCLDPTLESDPCMGSRADPDYCRPISITSMICKTMERVLNNWLLAYLEAIDLLSERQYGIRQNRSTGDLLVYATHIWSEATEGHGEALAVSLDISKAFDRRDIGAPVVLNGILWGVISSWKPEDCDVNPGISFVTLVSAANISTWIHATTHGHRWNHKSEDHYTAIITNDIDEYYDENNI
ncbi:kallikrein-14 [Aphomia sociella]